MRQVAAAAGVHEFALPAFLAKIDRGVPRLDPARLIPDLVDCMFAPVCCNGCCCASTSTSPDTPWHNFQ
jgi:hypothetical protein